MPHCRLWLCANARNLIPRYSFKSEHTTKISKCIQLDADYLLWADFQPQCQCVCVHESTNPWRMSPQLVCHQGLVHKQFAICHKICVCVHESTNPWHMSPQLVCHQGLVHKQFAICHKICVCVHESTNPWHMSPQLVCHQRLVHKQFAICHKM